MPLVRIVQFGAIVALAAGCRASPSHPVLSPLPATILTAAPQPTPPVAVRPAVVRIAFQETIARGHEAPDSDAFAEAEPELSLAWLVEEVQRQNSTLQAMVAAWGAAAERYPQVVALDDPMFMTMMAPASFGSPEVESAYVLEGAQKLPWFGTRAARGRMARGEASAAGQDAQATRLLLVEAAELAFLDYYLVRRQQDLNGHNIEVMRQFRDTAETRYRANQVTQRDVLQADVELTELDRRRIELARMHVVAVAKINTLVRRPPECPLPPPPARLEATPVSVDLDALQQGALQQRPDVAAAAARLRAEQASVTLARKGHFPDGEFFGRYDSFWQPADTQSDLRGQVGVRLNVPLHKGRLNAAVREAMLRASQRRAELEQKRLDVKYEVYLAHAQFEEAQQSLTLYAERLLPAAEANVAAARANYDVGKDSFLDLALAQRQLIEVREKQEQELTAYHRRLAELNRAVGGSLPRLFQRDTPGF